MSSSPGDQKMTHSRSISLPMTSHPYTHRVEEQLYRLRASTEATSSSSSSISHNLTGLKELYECVEDLLQMQHTQQFLSSERGVDGVLDGSLRLVDVCDTARDVLSQMRQSAQDIQSSLRRKRIGDLVLTNEIGAYMISKKKVNKVICKCLGDLKRMEKNCFFPVLDKNDDLVAMISVLREVEAITVTVFESLLSFLSSPKTRSKSSWSLVSNLMGSKRIACEDVKEDTNEVEKVEIVLNNLNSNKKEDVKHAQKPLEALEMTIQDLEDGLESVFRCLIKTRVSLLNILTQ